MQRPAIADVTERRARLGRLYCLVCWAWFLGATAMWWSWADRAWLQLASFETRSAAGTPLPASLKLAWVGIAVAFELLLVAPPFVLGLVAGAVALARRRGTVRRPSRLASATLLGIPGMVALMALALWALPTRAFVDPTDAFFAKRVPRGALDTLAQAVLDDRGQAGPDDDRVAARRPRRTLSALVIDTWMLMPLGKRGACLPTALFTRTVAAALVAARNEPGSSVEALRRAIEKTCRDGQAGRPW